MIGREDARAVEVEPGQRAGRGAGGDDEVAARDLGAVGDAHAVTGAVGHFAATRHDGDVAALQQRLEARS